MIDLSNRSFYLGEPVSVFVVTVLFFEDVSPEALYFINFRWFLDLSGLFP